MRAVLTIAGSDSVAGAGVQADLKTFAAFGVYGTCAITAVTSQNTSGVTEIAALEADLVASQIEAVASDISLDATKTGMLATAATVEAVVAAIEDFDLPLVVVDPVVAASDGSRLLDDDGVQAMMSQLLRHARVVTPNVPEAEILSGCRIATPDDARRAAHRIHDLGVSAVIVTGGHWTAPGGSGDAESVMDLLFDGQAFTELRATRVAVRAHGTGCAYASALAAGLALGLPLPDAAERAQRYVAGALARALTLGRGARLLDHFWEREGEERQTSHFPDGPRRKRTRILES